MKHYGKKISFPIGIYTIAIHAGEEPDPANRAAYPNIVMSITLAGEGIFRFSVRLEDTDDLIKDLEIALDEV